MLLNEPIDGRLRYEHAAADLDMNHLADESIRGALTDAQPLGDLSHGE